MQRRTLWLIVAILGAIIFATLSGGGGLLTLLLAVTALLGETVDVSSALQVTGLITLGVGFGLPLAWQGWVGWKGRPSRPFDPTQARWLWFALLPIQLILTALGATVALLPLVPALLLPPIHILAMSIPPLLILGLVGWGLRGRGGSHRDVVAGLAGGGCLGLTLSLIGEMLILVAVVTVVVIVVLATPGGPDRIQTLSKEMQNPAWLADPSNMAEIVLSPVVIVSALGIFCIPIPLIEELAKPLLGSVAGIWVRPRPARVFLWGVAAGAGFALAENLFNGAAGGAEGWIVAAVTRVGTTAMHCFVSGVVGWGWGELWTARRPLRLLGTFVAAVSIHALWNAAAISMSLSGIALQAHGGSLFQAGLAGVVLVSCAGILLLLTLTFLVALPLIARKLSGQQ